MFINQTKIVLACISQFFTFNQCLLAQCKFYLQFNLTGQIVLKWFLITE